MISVIVSIYNTLDNLELILQGLELQTYKDFEVIVSEDNDSKENLEFVSNARKKYTFNIKHVSQEDIGFRKTRILNKAVLIASGDYLVFIDGDCVPHKRHIESYAKYLTDKNVCMGRRCNISEQFTEKLLKSRNIKKLNLINVIRYGRHIEYAIYVPWNDIGNPERRILGCNWGISKQLLLDINGFDEDYIVPGVGEDHDIDWRLRKRGDITFLNIKRKVIVYHLHHKANYSQDAVNFVNNQEKEKMKEGFIICKNGIEKLK